MPRKRRPVLAQNERRARARRLRHEVALLTCQSKVRSLDACHMRRRKRSLYALMVCCVGLGVFLILRQTVGRGDTQEAQPLSSATVAEPIRASAKDRPALLRTNEITCGDKAGGACCPDGACVGNLTCDRQLHQCVSCGNPGESCCGGKTCQDGACCLKGGCLPPGSMCGSTRQFQGMCSGGRCAFCGGLGQACCGFGATSETGSCLDERTVCGGEAGKRTCVPCGEVDQPCCEGERDNLPTSGCVTELVCHSGQCRKCDAPGKPRCCQNGACQGGECCVDEICVAEGESCHGRGIVSENTSGVCMASKCECGSPGQPCCGLRCNDPGNICNANSPTEPMTCQPCGQPGGRCCPDNSCTGGCCVHNETGIPKCIGKGDSCGAKLGRCGGSSDCGGCGGIGQPCCEKEGVVSCSAPMSTCRVASKTCEICGSDGQSCCFPPGFDDDYQEGECYGKGLNCWPKSTTDRSTVCRTARPW